MKFPFLGKATSDPSPSEEPPLEPAPIEEPPIEQAPIDEHSAQEPPAAEPPVEQPPAHEPIIDEIALEQAALARIGPFYNRHEGQSCVIVGNGPSLNQTDLERLQGLPTFGLNKIYLLFNRSSYRPTYWVCVNFHVIKQAFDQLDELACPKFVDSYGWQLLGHSFADAEQHDELYLVKNHYPPGVGPLFFTTNPVLGMCQGHTVTYVALQLAYYMGFQTVYLVGVDHRFAVQGPANELVVADAADASHFDPNYFGPGTEWNLPDLEASETAYRVAKYNFERQGRQILDATVGGALQVFPKIDQYDIPV